MSIKVYVVEDATTIDFLQNNDLDGFKEYLAEDDTLDFGESEYFDSEAEAIAFCADLGHGLDERAPVERYLLRSCEPDDVLFIEAIEDN